MQLASQSLRSAWRVAEEDFLNVNRNVSQIETCADEGARNESSLAFATALLRSIIEAADGWVGFSVQCWHLGLARSRSSK